MFGTRKRMLQGVLILGVLLIGILQLHVKTAHAALTCTQAIAAVKAGGNYVGEEIRKQAADCEEKEKEAANKSTDKSTNTNTDTKTKTTTEKNTNEAVTCEQLRIAASRAGGVGSSKALKDKLDECNKVDDDKKAASQVGKQAPLTTEQKKVCDNAKLAAGYTGNSGPIQDIVNNCNTAEKTEKLADEAKKDLTATCKEYTGENIPAECKNVAAGKKATNADILINQEAQTCATGIQNNLSLSARCKEYQANGNAFSEATINEIKQQAGTVKGGSTTLKSSDIIAAPGLFTQSRVNDPYVCENFDAIQDTINTKMSVTGTPNYENVTKGEEKEGKISEILGESMMDANSGMLGINGEGKADSGKGIFAVNCNADGMSLGNQFITIGSPVNLTTNSIVMSVMGVMQKAAMACSVLLIVFFAFLYMIGHQKLDPVAFSIRLLVAILVVYNLPALLQDILNLNNVLVYQLSQIGNVGGQVGAADIATAGASGMGLIAAAVLKAGLTAMLTATAGLTLGLAIACLLVVLIVMFIIPVLRILIWWYARLLMIFVLAVIGPFFVILLALPQTASMTTKWLRAFIGEVFSQTIVVIVMVLFTNIFLHFGDFKAATGIGWVGAIFMLYAMIMFMAASPELSKTLIGGAAVPGMKDINNAALGAAAFLANSVEMGRRKAAEHKQRTAIDELNKQGDDAEDKMNDLASQINEGRKEDGHDNEQKPDFNTQNEQKSNEDEQKTEEENPDTSGAENQEEEADDQQPDTSGTTDTDTDTDADEAQADDQQPDMSGTTDTDTDADGTQADDQQPDMSGADSQEGDTDAGAGKATDQQPDMNGTENKKQENGQSGAEQQSNLESPKKSSGYGFDKSFLSGLVGGVASGSLSRQDFVNKAANEMRKNNPELSKKEAFNKANGFASQYEAASGMGLNAQQQFHKLRKSGDLDANKLKQIVEADQKRQGNFDKDGLSKAVHEAMSNPNFGGITPDKSVRDSFKNAGNTGTISFGGMKVGDGGASKLTYEQLTGQGRQGIDYAAISGETDYQEEQMMPVTKEEFDEAFEALETDMSLSEAEYERRFDDLSALEREMEEAQTLRDLEIEEAELLEEQQRLEAEVAQNAADDEALISQVPEAARWSELVGFTNGKDTVTAKELADTYGVSESRAEEFLQALESKDVIGPKNATGGHDVLPRNS